MVEYQLTRAADRDLNDIWRYTHEQWGVRQARKYLESLHNRMQELAKDPKKGTPSEDLFPRSRKYREGRHLIFFLEETGCILILRVLHERMDVINKLRESLG